MKKESGLPDSTKLRENRRQGGEEESLRVMQSEDLKSFIPRHSPNLVAAKRAVKTLN